MITYFNGKYYSNDKLISVNDRGLLLGDGLFETMLYKNRELIFYEFHINRLNKSLKKIFINFKFNKEDYKKNILNLIKKNNLINKSVSIRITVTRGESIRGIDISNKVVPTIIIKTTHLKNNVRFKPVKLGVALIKRNESSSLSTLKTLNYLDNILAKT